MQNIAKCKEKGVSASGRVVGVESSPRGGNNRYEFGLVSAGLWGTHSSLSAPPLALPHPSPLHTTPISSPPHPLLSLPPSSAWLPLNVLPCSSLNLACVWPYNSAFLLLNLSSP